jgi:tRNA (guanosine-2'-O-)-methyltransferase
MTPERIEKLKAVLQLRQPDLTVVLENVFDPHNLAAVMRTCDAVGIREVFAITDRIPERKNWGYRSSRSANKWVQLHAFTEREPCMAQVRSRYGQVLGSCLTEDAIDLYQADLTGSLALVFGNEKYGISDEMKKACDGFFRIPMLGMIPSLNISVACGITLYEAYRQKSAAGHYQSARLDASAQAGIMAHWMAEGADAPINHGTEAGK